MEALPLDALDLRRGQSCVLPEFHSVNEFFFMTEESILA